MATEENVPLLRIEKAQQQPDEGRFASPARSNDAEALPGLHREADVLEHWWAFGISKAHPLEPHLRCEGKRRSCRQHWPGWLARLCRRGNRVVGRARFRAVWPFLHHGD